MTKGIELEQGQYGLRAVVGTPWSDKLTEFLVRKQVAEIELNDGKGWRGDNINFLSEFPWLHALKILDFKIPSVEPIHCLHELRALDVMTYCKTEIRFSSFPKLEDCGLEWRPKALSLFECIILKQLFVNGYKGKSTAPFGQLVNLESLTILNAPIEDLRGLRPLKKLRFLKLGRLRCLSSLAGIEQLSNLDELWIQTCRRISAIDEIANLARLRKLLLDNNGDIESLKPLAGLDELELVGFCEATNIVDGDLSPLLHKKNLSRVAFQNRRHYSHRWEELGTA